MHSEFILEFSKRVDSIIFFHVLIFKTSFLLRSVFDLSISPYVYKIVTSRLSEENSLLPFGLLGPKDADA